MTINHTKQSCQPSQPSSLACLHSFLSAMHSQKHFLSKDSQRHAGLTRGSQLHAGLVSWRCSLSFLSSILISPVFQSCRGLLGEAPPTVPTPFTSWCRLRLSLSSPSIQIYLCPLSLLLEGFRPPTSLPWD